MLLQLALAWALWPLMAAGYIPSMIPPEIPSLYPLQYVTPGVVFQYAVESVNSAVVSALIPKDSNEALAIFISEGAGGFFGGIARRVIGRIDGNKLKGSSELISGAGGATYFGIAGAVRSLAYAGGASQLAVSLSALLTSVVISTVIRVRRNIIKEQQTTTMSFPKIKMYDLMRFRNPTMKDLMVFRKTGSVPVQKDTPEMRSKMSEIEFQADAAQFTLLSLLAPSSFLPMGGAVAETFAISSLERALLIGALCGLAGQGVREAKDRELEEQRRRVSRKRQKDGLDSGPAMMGDGYLPDYVLTRLARAAVEGAGQLLTYQAARDYVRELSPFFNDVSTVLYG